MATTDLLPSSSTLVKFRVEVKDCITSQEKEVGREQVVQHHVVSCGDGKSTGQRTEVLNVRSRERLLSQDNSLGFRE